jgi:AAA domain, putative AbiEii toxin, Type IV TA system
MMAWVSDIGWRLFARYPDSLNPFHEPAIVLVDEIDLHLHPKWQRQLRERLTLHFPNVQFIATAHSPLMVQAFLDPPTICREEPPGDSYPTSLCADRSIPACGLWPCAANAPGKRRFRMVRDRCSVALKD